MRRLRTWSAVVTAACLLPGALPSATAAEVRLVPNTKHYRTMLEAEGRSQAKCEELPGRVWAKHEAGSHCIAYYRSPGAAGAKLAILFFDGDVPPEMARDTVQMESYHVKIRSIFEQLARASKVPIFYVARLGVLGSSGNHGYRRSRAEFLALDRAVDLIKARYGIEQVALAGQSGGASAVAALLTFGRTDVACAVPGSGLYDRISVAVSSLKRQGKPVPPNIRSIIDLGPFYDPILSVNKIATRPERRLFVVGDVRDTRTPFDQQRRFAEKVRQAGHHSVLLEADGEGKERHGLALAAMRAALACALGKSDDDIRRLIAPKRAAHSSKTAGPQKPSTP